MVAPRRSFWSWFRSLFAPRRDQRPREKTVGAQEARVLAEFCRQYGLPFRDLALLKLALTHRSYLSVTGQGPRESNERLEFLGDSVLGLVTSEYLYRRHPDEHEGQLTKTKSLLVSKAILSRRALRIGLGRFVLMSHSEVESGGRQRLSILADAFEAVIGAIYLDQGFESARTFIHQHLLEEADAITSDKRHTNYKSHLQEYVQNAFRTHPVYRIRSEFGPDHSKHFVVEVMVGKRTLGEGRGHNKKEAEQAAARDALEKVERVRRKVREDDDREEERSREARSPRGSRHDGPRRPASSEPPPPVSEPVEEVDEAETADEPGVHEDSAPRRRRSRRGGRRRHARGDEPRAGGRPASGASRELDAGPEPAIVSAPEPDVAEEEPRPGTRRFQDPPGAIAPEEETPRSRPAPAAEVAASPAEPPTRVFGRGRRRDAAAAGNPAEGTGPPPAGGEGTPERRVDPFEPDVNGPSSGGSTVPVVDVRAAEPADEEESDRDRDSRIDEMERALESFGRRRPPDYGRRGRRR